jgi:ubiquitin-conjugating enzyme E2 Q
VAVADDAASVATLDEDLAILLYESEEDEKEEEDDDEQAQMSSVGKAQGKQSGKKTKTGVLQPNNVTDFKPDTLTQASLTLLAVAPAYATSSATKTLQKQLQATLKVQEEQAPHELGWSVSPLLINTVYQWIVELHSFDVDLPLAKDLKKVGIQSVVMEMRFPKDYPMTPPFVRIVRPRFLEFANGGGGHVTAGGALCLELLTNSGWSPISSIESVLLQIRLAICSQDPRPAKLQPGQTKGRVAEYTVQEAVSAYVRACRAHGWEVPDDFQRMAWF